MLTELANGWQAQPGGQYDCSADMRNSPLTYTHVCTVISIESHLSRLTGFAIVPGAEKRHGSRLSLRLVFILVGTLEVSPAMGTMGTLLHLISPI